MAKLLTPDTSILMFFKNNMAAVWLLCLSLLTLIASWSPVVAAGSFDASLTAAGQWWRPFSAWVCQLNFAHWAINQWGLVVMAFLLPKRLPWLKVMGFAWVWFAASLMLLQSEYAAYVGLSGLLYGWLVLAAYYSPYYSNLMKGAFIAVISVKVLLENGLLFGFLWQSDMLETLLNAPVAHQSHLWGLISGLVFIAAVQLLQLLRR
ncbi:rhomboid family intramembrane serine protease [Reinekea marinisedimentorum]|nr:rhomboid family intramembrane serine protease [Reinekea marinisedimentorum]